MSLFPCPECRRPVSSKAESCPHCGRPLDSLLLPEGEETVDSSKNESVAQSFVTLLGTSASARRSPRELDLALDGEELQLRIHSPGGTQPSYSVGVSQLQQAFDDWKRVGNDEGQIEVSARKGQTTLPVTFVFDASYEVEVQAGWWIWVNKHELTAALSRLGLRSPL
jgi:hypothetical protein